MKIFYWFDIKWKLTITKIYKMQKQFYPYLYFYIEIF